MLLAASTERRVQPMPSPANGTPPGNVSRHPAGRNSAVSPTERLAILCAADTSPRMTVASLARRFGRTRETIARVILQDNDPDR
jgi:hypothetical protein